MSSIAITLNSILTACYRACYADAAITDEDELMLLTSPLSATSEVEALFTSQLIDWKSALPAALHSLGCSANEITEALRRRGEKEEAEKKAAAVEAQSQATSNEASSVGVDQAKANVDATVAQTKKTEAETKAVGSSSSSTERPSAGRE